MRKLTLGFMAVCLSAAVASAYAAQGSPADTDKAGRAGPGTAAGQMGAADPTPGKAGPGSTGSATGTGARTGASSGTGTGSGAGMSSGGTGATTGGGMDDTKGSRTRRAARASKG